MLVDDLRNTLHGTSTLPQRRHRARFRARFSALLRLLACLLAMFGAAQHAHAQVELSFHSFNGAVLWGRYPHAFIALDGALEANGARVHENYGFTAVKISPAILRHRVRGTLSSEKDKYLRSTNVHARLKISDDTYFRIRTELTAWKDSVQEQNYDLDRRNCVHFVARIAEIAGFSLAVPPALVRKPRAYLNLLVQTYPALNGKTFD